MDKNALMSWRMPPVYFGARPAVWMAGALMAAGGGLWAAGRVMVLRQNNRRLWALSYRDELTGIYNRRYLLEFLTREMARSRRTGAYLSVMMLDIDHFKSVNDRRGHAFGDRVLIELCACVAGCLREYDILSRYGGEEFVVVLTDTGPAEARAVARRINKAVAAIMPGGEKITVSIGLVTYRGGEDMQSLIGRADRCLYAAKKNGRNLVVSE